MKRALQTTAMVGVFAASAVVPPPEPAPAKSARYAVPSLVRHAHGDPRECDIWPHRRWGPRQLECVIRVVWPRHLERQAIRVATCESGGTYLLADPPPNPASTAKGLFQFLDSTWATTPQFRAERRRHGTRRAYRLVRDPVANTRGARWLYRTGGRWRQWVCKP